MKRLAMLIFLSTLAFAQGPAVPTGFVKPELMAGQGPNGTFYRLTVDTSGNLNVTGGSGFPSPIQGYVSPFAPVALDSSGNWHYFLVDSSGNLKVTSAGGGVPSGPASGDLGSTYPAPTVVNGSNITNSSIPNSGLVHPSVTVNGQAVALGATGNVNNGAGTHSVALNEGAGSAIGGAGPGTLNMLLASGGASADPIYKSWTDLDSTQYVAASGTAQAQVVALAPPVTALVAGLELNFLPVAANTAAAPTLAVNGLTAKPITKVGTTALVANDLTTTAIASVIYDGTEFQLQNPQTTPAGTLTAQGSSCALGGTCFPNPKIDVQNFTGGANECANALLAGGSVTGPPANTAWVDLTSQSNVTEACTSTNLYLKQSHFQFNCSLWTTDLGFNLGPSQTEDGPTGGDNGCLQFVDSSSFPGTGAITIAAGSSGAGSFTVNKATGETDNVDPADYVAIAGDTTVTPWGTGVYRVTAGVALTSGGGPFTISVIPNLGQNETASNVVTLYHPIKQMSGSVAGGFAGATAGVGFNNAAIIGNVSNTSHNEICFRNEYSQDQTTVRNLTTSNCGFRDGQIVNTAADSSYGPIYSTHSNSNTCPPIGWEFSGQGGNWIDRLTDVFNACNTTTTAPLIGIAVDGNVAPTNGAGPHGLRTPHVEGPKYAVGFGYLSQLTTAWIDGMNGCPQASGSTTTSGTITAPATSVPVASVFGNLNINGGVQIAGAGAAGATYFGTITNIVSTTLTISPATSTTVTNASVKSAYPDGFGCYDGIHIFNASTGASGLASNSTGNILITSYYGNTGTSHAVLQDDIPTGGNTLTQANNPNVLLYSLDSNTGVFGIGINTADPGLTGIFTYGNILSGVNAGVSEFTLNALTGVLQGITFKSTTYQSTGAAATATYTGGANTSGTNGIVGGALFRGSDNSSAGASGLGGFGIFRGGLLSAASPNAAELEGASELAAGALKGAAIANIGDVVCGTTTGYTLTDCPIGSENIVGIATSTTNPITYVMNGTTPVKTDNATTIGDIICAPTVTTGLGHDNGTTACPPGIATIGTVLQNSGALTLTIVSGTTTTTVTPASTLPIVSLAIAAAPPAVPANATISGADYTNSTVTPSTVWSFTLPATTNAKNYAYQCEALWESTNTTLVGPVIGLNISAAPTQLTGSAWVQSGLAGTDTTNYLSNTTTGSQTLITGAAAGVTSTNYRLSIWGTIEGAPTAGSTFIINAASTSGTTATLNIRRGGQCKLQQILATP